MTIITSRSRNWRSFETPTAVELRLAGDEYTGKALIDSSHAGNPRFMTEYLKKRPVDAKAFGLARNEVIESGSPRSFPPRDHPHRGHTHALGQAPRHRASLSGWRGI